MSGTTIRLPAVLLTMVGLAMVGLGLLGVPAAAAPVTDDVAVRLTPRTSTVDLGEKLDLRIEVTNHTPSSTRPLVVHLDVLDPRQSTSVDPEDWTSTLSRRIGVLAPGASTTIDWTVQPISGGRFTAYAVALTPGGADLATSDALLIEVTSQRTLDPGGILAVSITAPLLVGALLVLQLRRGRNRGRVRRTGRTGT